ncbi:MAG: hypothetical protein ACD_62C00148G0009 [uncultured bacterium]|nr:MAG: hypothetical protein ACD_62C00148G0009 [uncultured bacterium]
MICPRGQSQKKTEEQTQKKAHEGEGAERLKKIQTSKFLHGRDEPVEFAVTHDRSRSETQHEFMPEFVTVNPQKQGDQKKPGDESQIGKAVPENHKGVHEKTQHTREEGTIEGCSRHQKGFVLL